MSLIPEFATIAATRGNIITILKAGLPLDTSSSIIASSLSLVNQWATQIPLVLSSKAPSNALELVFAIRKDLFVAPSFEETTLDIPVADLPDSFRTFLAFSRELSQAQKNLAKVLCNLFVFLSDRSFLFFFFL